MTPNQPSLDAGPLLTTGLAYANAHAYNRVIVDSGSYYFLSLSGQYEHVLLSGAANLSIDFQGSDLYFANPLVTALDFTGGFNTTLQNFTVDYLQLPFTQLQISAVDVANSQLTFIVPPGWQSPDALNSLVNAEPPGGAAPWLFIFRGGRIAPGPYASRIPVQTPFSPDQITVLGNGSNTAANYLAQIRPGDTAVLAVRSYAKPAFAMVVGGERPTGCNQCTFRNIRIYSSASTGFFMEGAQNSLLDHIYVMPRPATDRLVSTMADGISLFMSGPNNTVQHCRSIRTLDDGWSIPQWVFASIQAAPSSQTLQVQGVPGTALQQGTPTFFPVPNGTQVDFEGPDGTMLGQATITSQSTLTPVNNLNQMLLTFDTPPPSGLVGAYLYPTSPELRGGGLRIFQNTMQEQVIASGISIWGPMNATVAGNYIRRSHWAGISIIHTLVPNGWIVPPTVNSIFDNNVVDGTNLAFDGGGNEFAGIQSTAWMPPNSLPMSASEHQNLTVSGNFVADPSRSAVWIGNTSGGSVTNNYFLNPNNNASPQGVDYSPSFLAGITLPVAVIDSSNITTTSNTVDHTSSRMFATDLQYNELAAYAPGSTYRLNAYHLGSLAGPAVTLTDSAGAVSSVAIKNTLADALDVQIPSSAALGSAYFTLVSGSATYFATLFLDSQDNLPAFNGCTYETSMASSSASGIAATVPILVVTQARCSYQVLATDPFVDTGASTTGTAVIPVGFALNDGTPRTTTIEIAGQPITLTQGNACDINNNGTATVAAVQLIVNQALGSATALNDLNQDSVVNVVDVQIVINAALGLTCAAF
jgi:hypothetical protein